MRTDKELGAFRVMEALSAVDEELLERSEETAVKSKNKMTVRGFVRRYRAACAACLCLLVLGAAYFGLRQMRMGSFGESKNTNMNGGGADNGFGPMAAGEENAAPEDGAAPEYAPQEAAGNSLSNNGMPAGIEPEWLEVEQLAAQPEKLKTEEAARVDEMQQSVDKLVGSDDAATQGIPEAEEFGAEAAVPERYSPVETETGFGNQGSLLYGWSDGEHGLWLRITQTELTAGLRFTVEPPVYTVQEEWRDLFPDAGADGYAQFALLYENGMLVEYCGALDREEVIRLLESLVQ